MVFGFVHSDPVSSTSGHHIIDLEIIVQNISTSFTPMYYIMGVVSEHDLASLVMACEQEQHSGISSSFDSIYSQLSPTCCFLPLFGKSFSEKLRLSIRFKNTRHLIIEEAEKLVRHKMVKLANEVDSVHLLFGLYCS